MNDDFIKLISVGNNAFELKPVLEIDSDTLPCVIGCSVIDKYGKEYDVQHQIIYANGTFEFPYIDLNMDFVQDCKIYMIREGAIMFALWKDDSFSHRICDTGWVKLSQFGHG